MMTLRTTKDPRKFEVFGSVVVAMFFVGATYFLYAPRFERSATLPDSASMYASYCWTNAKKLVR